MTELNKYKRVIPTYLNKYLRVILTVVIKQILTRHTN